MWVLDFGVEGFCVARFRVWVLDFGVEGFCVARFRVTDCLGFLFVFLCLKGLLVKAI